MKHPKLSLVTGTLNREAAFKRLLDSIVQHTTVSYEVVVSDASDPSYTFPLPPHVRMIEEKPRLGCVQGYNRAFRACLGDWIIHLNDDAEVCANYDTEAIRFMEANPQIGLGALHYSENGSPFHCNSAWGCVYGNFGIISNALGNQVGFFDEDLIMYGNDNSLALRVLLAGRGVTDIPSARILHHSVNDAVRRENQQYKMRDNDVLTRKYMPLKPTWLATYRKYQMGSTIPWDHGQPLSIR